MHAKVNQQGDVIQFPYSLTDLRRDNPATSFPKTISDELALSFGVVPVTVTMTEKPAFNAATHRVAQTGWQLTGYDASPVWSIIALTQNELDENASASQTQTLINLADNFIAGTGTGAQAQAALGHLIKRLVRKGIIP